MRGDIMPSPQDEARRRPTSSRVRGICGHRPRDSCVYTATKVKISVPATRKQYTVPAK